MKTFKQFVSEQPTNHVGNGGYTRSADASGPVAGDDKKLFRGLMIYSLKIFKHQQNLGRIDMPDFQTFILS